MRQPASQYPASHYSASDYGQRDDDGYQLAGEERDDEPVRRDRRLPAILLTLAVMALFVGGLWFAYVQGTRHAAAPAQSGDGVPVIRADERPTKVKPEQPGGMPAPDQNVSLYSANPVRPSSEKLLPPPEQPMPRPVPPPPPPKAAATPAPSATTPPAPADTSAPPAAAPNLTTKAAEPKPLAQPKPATPTKPVAATEASHNGTIQVRVGSVRSPEAAREEWTRLKRENADLLGSLRANAIRTDLGEKGIYYRIEAGPFAEAAAAERLCGELKRRNRGCILAR